MKLAGLLEVISTYKTCVSELFSWWLKVRSISWPPIISLWGNMKMLPVSHKPTETTQFYQDHGHSPHLWWSRCNWWLGSRGGHLRSNEVIIRFWPITRDRVEIETRKWCQATWHHLRDIDPLRSWPYLDLTWPEPRFWNWPFKFKKYNFRTGSARRKWLRHVYFRVSQIKKVNNEKQSPWKR